MNTERREIRVNGLPVEIVRKAIKNLHLGVYPPHGRVRVAAPLAVSDGAVRLAVIGKLRWIKKQQAKFAAQPRQSEREMVSGESHYYLGKRYRLRVVRHNGPDHVLLQNRSALELYVRREADSEERELVLERWYRECLRELALPLLVKWESRLGVAPVAWGIKKMKTKWGACNVRARRIWLNLELVKKPIQCLEYLIVHELAHLIERRHNERFVGLMDDSFPRWRLYQRELNAAPLGHASWTY